MTLKIQEIHKDKYNRLIVDGIFDNRQNNSIEIGEFRIKNEVQGYENIEFDIGIIVHKSGSVDQTILKMESGLRGEKTFLENHFQNDFGSNRSQYYKRISLSIFFRRCMYQFGWRRGSGYGYNRTSTQNLLIFEGDCEYRYCLYKGSGLIALCQESNREIVGQMIFGKKFIGSLDIEKFEDLKINDDRSEKRKVLVMDENNNLNYVILGK